MRIEFYVDGAHVGSATPADPTTVWALTPGRHVLEVAVELAGGEIVRATAPFEVRG